MLSPPLRQLPGTVKVRVWPGAAGRAGRWSGCRAVLGQRRRAEQPWGRAAFLTARPALPRSGQRPFREGGGYLSLAPFLARETFCARGD